ncbi:hypothetical protein CYMTET_46665 [Cymbomonas tetramitiformis]|uniref:UDP-glucose 4-epimerase n=1 Tax=Cymbomonas tetramitiformis TaxID=36881 RepID=A0AAE0BXM4_9CHLO|nr:hypothetical protein CYMTET_46665 [Cymbomonas tetramitiformis]
MAKDRIARLTMKKIIWYNVDLLDYRSLELVFQRHKFAAVIHFAALKAVGESVEQPVKYYDHNLRSSLNVLKAMQVHGCRRFVFSSSATVYGIPKSVPLVETVTVGDLGDVGTRAGAKSIATNPYGQTKVFNERILEDLAEDSSWDIISLRYFNPVGAHPSGCLGEDPNGIPNNLMPFLLKVAKGEYANVKVFGNDYPTKDGTGVRDYIHVVDLAQGHTLAVDSMLARKSGEGGGYRVYNLGSGVGYSVMEMIKAMETASGQSISVELAPRRAGDIAECYADASKALIELGFRTNKTLQQMCDDSWRFVQGQCTYP